MLVGVNFIFVNSLHHIEIYFATGFQWNVSSGVRAVSWGQMRMMMIEIVLIQCQLIFKN
jgi:hypothetical protein